MRSFSDIRDQPSVKEFLRSPLGTLYMRLDESGLPREMIRHFDSDLEPKLVRPFVEIIRNFKDWVESHPKLLFLVKVEQPSEVGHDFITRAFHVYFSSTRTYMERENPPKAPAELTQMQDLIRAEIGKPKETREAILEKVIIKSLLEPTGKTLFDETSHQFVVVEPKINREDLERWLSLAEKNNG